ncbi:hypothetical protein HPB50_028406 [Hyalomma asiaticum]|nr:hypothetical protein HPB50_028406 [Hyalomma asiaticum]
MDKLRPGWTVVRQPCGDQDRGSSQHHTAPRHKRDRRPPDPYGDPFWGGDRRRGNKNQGFIRRFNREASFFNRLLRSYCKHSSLVHVLDHALEWLPPARVLAADGVHLSFEGVALVASHVRQLCFDSPSQATPPSWEDCAPARQQMVSSPTETRSMSATGPKQKKPTNKMKNRDGRLLEGHDQSTSRVLHSDPAPAVQLLSRGHRLPQQLQEYRPVTKTSISTAETTAGTNSPTAIASVRPPTGRRSSLESKGCRAPAQVPSSTVDTNIPASGPPTSAAGPSSQPRIHLGVQLHNSLESSVAGFQLRRYLQFAGQVTEVLWVPQLRYLRERVTRVSRKAKGKVHVPEGLQLPDDVIQVLELGPKFGVQSQRTNPELLTVVRQVSRNATEGQEERLTSEGVDALIHLGVQLHNSLESSVAGFQLRRYLQFAGQVTEVLWVPQLRYLRERVTRVSRKAKGKVHVPEGLQLPDDVIQVLELGPKFGVQSQRTNPELLTVVRQVSRNATEATAVTDAPHVSRLSASLTAAPLSPSNNGALSRGIAAVKTTASAYLRAEYAS